MFFKSIAKQTISSGIFSSFIRKKKFVFLFHDISEKNAPVHSGYYSTTPARFKLQLEFLNKNFKLVSLESLFKVDSHSGSENLASVVFDDGFHSVYEYAFPLLTENKIPFTIFINKRAVLQDRLWVTDLIINKNDPVFLKEFYSKNLPDRKISFEEFSLDPFRKALDVLDFSNLDQDIALDNLKSRTFCPTSELRIMLDSGNATIASHSADHFVLSACNTEMLKSQIHENKEFLKASFGLENDPHFAIPFGNKRHYNAEVIAALKDSGYKYIFTTNPDSFDQLELQSGLTLIPRIPVYDESTPELKYLIHRTVFKKFDF